MHTKPIHGNPPTFCKLNGLEPVSPVPCDFRLGQKVIFTNDYGIEFEMQVVGFSKDVDKYGGFIHLIRFGTDGSGSAWWFQHKPRELRAA